MVDERVGRFVHAGDSLQEVAAVFLDLNCVVDVKIIYVRAVHEAYQLFILSQIRVEDRAKPRLVINPEIGARGMID